MSIRVIYAGAVNIKFENTALHTPESYVELIKFVNDKKIIESYRHLTLGLIKYVSTIDVAGESVMYGQFMRCTDISDACKWYDTDAHELIEDEDGNPIQQVENNLKPNSEFATFLFYPKGHRFFFETSMTPSGSISPGSVKSLLEAIFLSDEVMQRFGNIFVAVETEKDAIDRILNLPQKDSLYLEFTIPNGEGLSDKKQEVLDRARATNTAKYSESYKAFSGSSLEYDEEAVAKIEIAGSNGGYVEAKGIDIDNKKAYINTKDYPIEDKIEYNESETTRMNALINWTYGKWQYLRNRG